MQRKNRHKITDYGWVHEQDNIKILINNDEKIIAEEKGWNKYVKTEDSKCQAAKDWWVKNENYWREVRNAWNDFYNSKETISFHKSVDKKPMFSGFFELDWNDEFVNNLKQHGYLGKTDEEIVDRWFQTLCRTIGNEQGIDITGSGYVQINRRDDGKTEVS